MNAKMLITGVAVAVLAAGAAFAQTDASSGSMGSTSQPAAGAASTDMSSTHAMSHHTMRHRHHTMHETRGDRGEGGAYAAPQQPIPYADLGKYEKASPRRRVAMGQQANTGAAADTAATSPANGSNMGAAGSDTGAMQQQPGGQAPATSMGSMASPRTDGTGAMDTNPPVNGATTGAADQMPTAGMGHNGSDATGTPAAGTPNQSSGPTPH